MRLRMFSNFSPILRARVQLKEDVRLLYKNEFVKYEDRYAANMNRKSCWANKWMHEPRRNICRL